MASPEAAWILLKIARDAGAGADLVSAGLNGLTIANSKSVDDFFTTPFGNVMRENNVGVGGYADRIVDLTETQLGYDLPVTDPIGKAGAPANALDRAGYLDVYDTLYTYGDEIEWKLEFTNANDYDIFRRSGGGAWIADGSGSRTDDSYSNSKVAYILTDWWNPALMTAAGNEIYFTTEPSDDIIQMPVLFYEAGNLNGTSPASYDDARAFTSAVVNSIVHGTTIIIPRADGPDIGGVDLFKSYIDDAHRKVGFTNVIHVDDQYYHDDCGSVAVHFSAGRRVAACRWCSG